MTAITSLSSLGETFDPILSTKNSFDFKHANLKLYIAHHHVKNTKEVSDMEHINFLTLWLSYFLFFTCSLQISKGFIPLAIQIHEGQQIYLEKLLLSYLYKYLGLASFKINLLSNTNRSFSLSDHSPFIDRSVGPTWFKNPFLGVSLKATTKSNVVRPLLTPTILSFRINTDVKGYSLMSYQPNLVAHQF